MVLTFHSHQPHTLFEVHFKVQISPPPPTPSPSPSLAEGETPPVTEVAVTETEPLPPPIEIEYLFVVDVNSPLAENETERPETTSADLPVFPYEEDAEIFDKSLYGDYHERELFALEEEEEKNCDREVSEALRRRESRCENWVQRYKRSQIEKRQRDRLQRLKAKREEEERRGKSVRDLRPEDFPPVEVYPWEEQTRTEALSVQRGSGRKLLDAFGDSLM
jgi:hypothetical protein